MSRANIIITSVKVKAELTRQAMTVKSDGRNCGYKLKHVGHPTDANYDAVLAEAKPATDVFPIPMNTADPQFKENLALSKFRMVSKIQLLCNLPLLQRLQQKPNTFNKCMGSYSTTQ